MKPKKEASVKAKETKKPKVKPKKRKKLPEKAREKETSSETTDESSSFSLKAAEGKEMPLEVEMPKKKKKKKTLDENYDKKPSVTAEILRRLSIKSPRTRRSTISYMPPTSANDMHWLFATFLLLNCGLGAGILNYPYAYHKVGGVYVATAVQLVLIIVMTITALIPIYCAKMYNCDSYYTVMYVTNGIKFHICASVTILLTCFVLCIAFLVLIGDQFENLFTALYGKSFCVKRWYLNKKIAVTATAILFILPMCYFKNLDFLKYFSVVGLFTMLYISFLSVYHYFYMDIPRNEIIIRTLPTKISDVFVIIPVFTFSYQFHELAVPVYSCMKDKRMTTSVKTLVLTMTLLFIVYCTSGYFGYYTFGHNSVPDIILAYDGKDPKVLIGMAALIIKMISTYPQILQCGRSAFVTLYIIWRQVPFFNITREENKHHVMISTCWFTFNVIFAIFTPDIDHVIKFLGSLASVNVFILPGFCLISLAFQKNNDLKDYKCKLMVCLASVIILFGAFTFGVVIVDTILEAIFTHKYSTQGC